MTEKRRCADCKEIKPIGEFHNVKVHCYCKPCANARNRLYHAANPARSMVRSAKKRAKKSGVPFDLQVSDITVPTTCPVLGIPLIPGGRGAGPSRHCPSLDRVKPELGYVKDNVIVVSLLANAIKSDASSAQIRMVADFYEALGV